METRDLGEKNTHTHTYAREKRHDPHIARGSINQNHPSEGNLAISFQMSAAGGL